MNEKDKDSDSDPCAILCFANLFHPSTILGGFEEVQKKKQVRR